jgi:hypothetical protein
MIELWRCPFDDICDESLGQYNYAIRKSKQQHTLLSSIKSSCSEQRFASHTSHYFWVMSMKIQKRKKKKACGVSTRTSTVGNLQPSRLRPSRPRVFSRSFHSISIARRDSNFSCFPVQVSASVLGSSGFFCCSQDCGDVSPFCECKANRVKQATLPNLLTRLRPIAGRLRRVWVKKGGD